MAIAQITMRSEADVKRQFEAICAEIGLSVNTALNIFVRRVVRDRRIPFELSADPFFGEENMGHLREAVAAVEAGRVSEHELIED